MDDTRQAELERENALLRAENERLHHLLAEAKGSAAGRRDPGDGVPPGVAVLDPEIDPEAETVRAHLEEQARAAERRSGADHA